MHFLKKNVLKKLPFGKNQCIFYAFLFHLANFENRKKKEEKNWCGLNFIVCSALYGAKYKVQSMVQITNFEWFKIKIKIYLQSAREKWIKDI